MQVLKTWDFLSPLVLQKMKVSQLDHYDEPFYQLQYTHGFCLFVCSNSNPLISLIPPNCFKFQTFTQLWYYKSKKLYREFIRQANGLTLNISVLQGLLRVNGKAEKDA